MTEDLTWASGEEPLLIGRTPDRCRVVVVRRTYNYGRSSGEAYWTSVVESRPDGCQPMVYDSNRKSSQRSAVQAALNLLARDRASYAYAVDPWGLHDLFNPENVSLREVRHGVDLLRLGIETYEEMLTGLEFRIPVSVVVPEGTLLFQEHHGVWRVLFGADTHPEQLTMAPRATQLAVVDQLPKLLRVILEDPRSMERMAARAQALALLDLLETERKEREVLKHA